MSAPRAGTPPSPSPPDLRHLVAELRNREFPWTAATTYLDAASTGPLPERTRLVLDAFNAKRTAPHQLSVRERHELLVAAREAAARLIGAGAEEIALVPNTTTGLNLAARALRLRAGEGVLLCDREFPANVYPWLALKENGVDVELAPVGPEGFPDEDFLVERLTDPRVRVLAVSLVQFANGYRADLDRLGAACRANGAALVVDAIQGLGNSPLDVRATPVDILACGGQKWLLSPWGSGFCYVRRELVGRLEPLVVGWLAFEGTDDFNRLVDYRYRFRDDATRFEVATLAFQDQLGMTTSLGLLLDLGLGAVAEYVTALGEPLLAWAGERGVRVLSPTGGLHRSAIVAIAPPEAPEAYRRLKRAGVVCALREGALRFSPHCYNTIEEMEKVVEVLDGGARAPSLDPRA